MITELLLQKLPERIQLAFWGRLRDPQTNLLLPTWLLNQWRKKTKDMAGGTQSSAEIVMMIYSEINVLTCGGSQSSAFLHDWNPSPYMCSEEGTQL